MLQRRPLDEWLHRGEHGSERGAVLREMLARDYVALPSELLLARVNEAARAILHGEGTGSRLGRGRVGPLRVGVCLRRRSSLLEADVGDGGSMHVDRHLGNRPKLV